MCTPCCPSTFPYLAFSFTVTYPFLSQKGSILRARFSQEQDRLQKIVQLLAPPAPAPAAAPAPAPAPASSPLAKAFALGAEAKWKLPAKSESLVLD